MLAKTTATQYINVELTPIQLAHGIASLLGFSNSWDFNVITEDGVKKYFASSGGSSFVQTRFKRDEEIKLIEAILTLRNIHFNNIEKPTI